mmetsp:Transcript_84808/g.162307  ORF Transcript_84808/g.162307 Transcript_84808/m.162307 type:complete len:228 (-) Transcript_84808:271-954(-)
MEAFLCPDNAEATQRTSSEDELFCISGSHSGANRRKMETATRCAANGRRWAATNASVSWQSSLARSSCLAVSAFKFFAADSTLAFLASIQSRAVCSCILSMSPPLRCQGASCPLVTVCMRALSLSICANPTSATLLFSSNSASFDANSSICNCGSGSCHSCSSTAQLACRNVCSLGACTSSEVRAYSSRSSKLVPTWILPCWRALSKSKCGTVSRLPTETSCIRQGS